MSATNRGSTRNERDFYPTPLSSFNPLIPFLPRDVEIWECAAGDNRLVDAMLSAGLQAYGTDLEPQSTAVLEQDFLTATRWAACLVTNPPFSLAFEFCKKASQLVDEYFLLLPLPFLASAGRRLWFRANEPGALFILSDRPSFVRVVKCGRKCGWRISLPAGAEWPRTCPQCGEKADKCDSDATDYAWFYWGARHRGIFHL